MTPAPDRVPRPAGWMRPARWVPGRWLRLPRRTIRLRLTLLYGGLFLLSGASLLAITYVLVSHRLPVVATTRSGAPAQPGGPAVTAPGQLPGITGGRDGAQVCYFVSRGGSPSLPGPPPSCVAYAEVASRQHAAELSQLLAESGIALAIMTVASIGLGWLVAGRVLRPLRTITAAARSISASSLHARLGLAGPKDELKELGDTFDGLLARLETAFGAQRQFVANASHELRTPLARQRTLIEVALAEPDPSVVTLREIFGRLLAAGEQQERLIEALLTLALSQRGLDQREAVDLAAIAGEVMLARRPEAERKGLTVTTGLRPAPALGDGRLAERLVTNLVDNAVRHNVCRGSVQVTTGTWAGQAVLTVSSTGPVIQPADVGRLFQPFARCGPGRTADGDGLGLGLSIVHAIAQAHGARLEASARPGGGLGVQVRFPAVASG